MQWVQLTLSWGDPHASPSRSQDSEKVSKTTEDLSCSTIYESLTSFVLGGSSGKMYKVRSPPIKGEPLEPSSGRWENSGMLWGGECWTLKASVCLNRERESSLSELLQDHRKLTPSYLGRTLAAGMLKRIPNRPKVKPILLQALETARDNDQPFAWSSTEADTQDYREALAIALAACWRHADRP